MSFNLEFSPEQLALKPKFAAALLENPTNPFIAGQAVFPGDTARALFVSTHWLNDPEVAKEKARLRSKGADLDVLPGKADLLRSIWERMTARGCLDEDFVKLAKLYAEVKSLIEKPNTAVNVNVNNNRVMVIRDQGTDAEWESKVAKQQEQLMNASATRH
jgi:hypothetical protein